MLQIYGDSISGNCLKVKWVCEYLMHPYSWVETSVLARATRTSEFLSINPIGQVPFVLLDGGRPLAESNAIMLHLAEGSDLIPADPYDRARMLQWLFWEQYSHEPYIAVARFQMALMGRSADALDPNLFERGNAALARMEAELVSRAFLVGDRPTLADVALVAYTRWAGEGGFDLGRYPSVQAWVARVEDALKIED